MNTIVQPPAPLPPCTLSAPPAVIEVADAAGSAGNCAPDVAQPHHAERRPVKT